MQREAERRTPAVDTPGASLALDSTRAVASLVGSLMATIAHLRRQAIPRSPTVASVRLVRAGCSSVLTRSGPLTPYAIETLHDDVRGIAAGARLDVVLTSECDDDAVDDVRRQLGPLRRHGVFVGVARAHRADP